MTVLTKVELPILCDICPGHATWRILADDGAEVLSCGYDLDGLLQQHAEASAVLRRVS